MHRQNTKMIPKKALIVNPPPLGELNINIEPSLSRCVGVPSKANYIWPPVGLLYIASILEARKVIPRIIDLQVESTDIERILKNEDFDYFIFNTGLSSFERDLKLLERYCSIIRKKRHNAKIITLGVGAIKRAPDILKYSDFIINSYPDAVIGKLIDNILSGETEKTEGIIFYKGRKIVNTPLSKVDLSQIPQINYSYVDMDKYKDNISYYRKFMLLITSRGCPNACRFCSSNMFSKGIKFMPQDWVEREIESIKKLGIRTIYFHDDNFTADKKRLHRFCHVLEKNRIKWRCLATTGNLSESDIALMKKSGCYQINFGVESGSNKILKAMNKRNDLESIADIFRICDRYNIETVAYFILGFPGETEATLKETFDFAIRLSPDFVTFNLFTPIPGTRIFDEYNLDDYNKLDFTNFSFCKISSKRLSVKENEFYRKFYLRPGYMIKRISKMGSLYDYYRLIKQNVMFWVERRGVLSKSIGAK